MLAVKLNALSEILQIQVRSLLGQTDYSPPSLAKYNTEMDHKTTQSSTEIKPKKKKKRPTTKAPTYSDEEEEDTSDEVEITPVRITTKRRKTTKNSKIPDEEEDDIQPISEVSNIEPVAPTELTRPEYEEAGENLAFFQFNPNRLIYMQFRTERFSLYFILLLLRST